MTLPKVLMTDVIRSTQQGDSHGGAYLIDLESRSHEQVLDWNRVEINWEGRGMGRGLRGICFVGDEIYIAASDELFVFDRAWNLVRSYKNKFLHHCHEISFDGERYIYMTSTSFDSVLRFDVQTESYDKGWWFGVGKFGVGAKEYDPNGKVGPPHSDTLHINQVFVDDGGIYISALRLGIMWTLKLDSGQVGQHAKIPVKTHNCQPIDSGLLVMNSTGDDCIVVADRRGKVLERFVYPLYEESAMSHTNLGKDYARQGFGRGLCVDADTGLVIAGSSPGTVSAFDRGLGEMVASVNVSMDIRNAPHGLEVWPW